MRIVLVARWLLPAVLVVAVACEPAQLNRWLARNGRPPLAQPELGRMARAVTLLEREAARRRSFVGDVRTVDAARLGLSWRPGCPVGPTDLRLLRLSFWGFDGRGHVGELIVHRTVAPKVVAVFRRLWEEKFPIWRMETAERFATPADFAPDGTFIERHDAPDTVNDTSAFFCRPTTGGRGWSQHSFGTAIDVNPVQNPYVKGRTTIPINGRWVPSAPGTAVAGGVLVAAFRDAGFVWGGTWRSLKDYMHFSVTGR